MCRHCDPQGRDAEGGSIDAAVGAAARQQASRWEVSRRLLLRAGLGILAAPAAQLLPACATVPVTGRSQLRLISEQEEAQVGVQAFQQLRQEEVQKGRLLTEREDPVAHAWVKRVVDRVILASGLGNAYRWEHMIINAPKTVNAAAIAGGRIIVYSGILPVSQNDAGLATILGHEVGHVMAHHTAERISQDQLVNVLAAAAGAAGGGELGVAAVGLGAQVGILLPYSRAQESEADHIGLLLMAKAGYDPREAVALWQRMERSSGGAGRGPEFLSTHPNPGTRITNLEALIPQAWPYYQNNALPLPNLQ
ncbi:MAG TPA: M48 family metallopeptidase [Candidatus Methylomirabilis sp.]|nr:M48 family metallopeptidase [Candidatus Methylomirabilis sp.]